MELSELCGKNGLFLEIAMPTICLCLMPKSQIEFIEGHAEWNNRDVRTIYNKSIDYHHSLKLSQEENRKFVKNIFMEAALLY